MAGIKDWLVVKNAPVLEGETITYIDEDEHCHSARVDAVLSSQMRVRILDKGWDMYLMYKDKGVTWTRK